jgi:hypothetical protein
MHSHRFLVEIEEAEDAGYKVGCIQEALFFMGLPYSCEYTPGGGYIIDIHFPAESLLETYTGLDSNLPT